MRVASLCTIVGAMLMSWATGCSEDRPRPAGSGTPAPTSSIPPRTQVADAGADAQVCPPPPYDCDAGNDGATGDPGPKPGGGNGGSSGMNGCGGAADLGTGPLLATGPTPAFVAAYNTALAAHQPGPFVVRFSNLSPGAPDVELAVAAAVPFGSGAAATVESPVTVIGSMSGGGVVSLPRLTGPFHMAFTRAVRPEGDIAVAAMDLSAPNFASCVSVAATATVYISSSEGGSLLQGQSLSSLLGAPTANVGGLGVSGWAIPLAGSLSEVSIR